MQCSICGQSHRYLVPVKDVNRFGDTRDVCAKCLLMEADVSIVSEVEA